MSLRQLTMDDSELGAMRFCKGCDEWWPDDLEFWYSHRQGRGRVCKACQRRWNRQSFESLRERRIQGRCVVGECPVTTPRDRCYYHARVLVA